MKPMMQITGNLWPQGGGYCTHLGIQGIGGSYASSAGQTAQAAERRHLYPVLAQVPQRLSTARRWRLKESNYGRVLEGFLLGTVLAALQHQLRMSRRARGGAEANYDGIRAAGRACDTDWGAKGCRHAAPCRGFTVLAGVCALAAHQEVQVAVTIACHWGSQELSPGNLQVYA